MYVCERETEREKQRENWKITRSTHWRESWLNSKAGSLKSSDFNTEYTSKNFDLISLIVAFFCFTNKYRESEKDFVCLCLLKTEGSCHVWSRRVVVFVTTEFTTVSNLVTRNFAPILVWDYLNFMMIHCYVQNQ